MERNNVEEIIKDYYSIKKFLIKKNNESNTSLDIESFDFNSNNNMKAYNNINNLKNKKNYLQEENLKLKLCLSNIKDKFNKEIKIKLNNINKQNQQLKEDQKTFNKNINLIEGLKEKIESYEKKINAMDNEYNNKNIYNKDIISLKKENKELKEKIKAKDKLIENIKNEISVKDELFVEINKIKNEINNIIINIDNLNKEIEEKNKIIKELEDNNIKQIRNNLKNKEKEILLREIKESNEIKNHMNKELQDIKLDFIKVNNQKEKLYELSQTTNALLKSELKIKDKIKNEYENKIQKLIYEYEQKEKTENGINQSESNEKSIIDENEKIKLENDALTKKLEDFNDLEKKYNDLFTSFSLLKEENILLKKNINSFTLKNNYKINKKINKLIDNEHINFNKPENKIESIEISNKKEYKINLNNSKEDSFDKSIKKEKFNIISKSPHINDDLPNLVYNKKKPKKTKLNSPRENLKSIEISMNNKKNVNNLSNELFINDKESKYRKILNEDKLEGDKSINETFNLYKPIKEGLLSFNLSKKNYNLIIPENYNKFWKNYDPQDSLQYNTLEGLFIINSKDYQLYYYSSKKNSFCELFCFNYDHKEGCLFLDNLSKNIMAIGGINTTSVEKFSFETGTMEELPELSTHRYKMTCCQVNNKIYCFFGLSLERKNESLIEYLDLENINQGWIEFIYENKTSFNLLTYMSCVNLNDCELLIIGGLIEDKIPNQKLLYFNAQKSEFIELNKDLPDSDVKKYLFSKNIMFNLFLKDNIISFTNIDDNNQVHILDNDLKYDLYLAPKF